MFGLTISEKLSKLILVRSQELLDELDNGLTYWFAELELDSQEINTDLLEQLIFNSYGNYFEKVADSVFKDILASSPQAKLHFGMYSITEQDSSFVFNAERVFKYSYYCLTGKEPKDKDLHTLNEKQLNLARPIVRSFLSTHFPENN